jgi:hypothetical protein
MVANWESVYPQERKLVVTLQTGENPEDRRFEGDIIGCTCFATVRPAISAINMKISNRFGHWDVVRL